jgi:hypothetical protein
MTFHIHAVGLGGNEQRLIGNIRNGNDKVLTFCRGGRSRFTSG